MKKVTLYTTDFCPYCRMAKNLLNSKNVHFEEINLQDKPDELLKLKKKTQSMTVPQIFIEEEFIGGYTELAGLNISGDLDKKLLDS